MHKKTFICYLVCIHLILVTILIKSDFIYLVKMKLGSQPEEITDYYHSLTAFHFRIDKNLPPKSTLFIGDSHVQGLAVSAISSDAVNYGIGNDTTVGVLQRLPYYESLTSSKAVVLAIGFNDLRFRNNAIITENIKKILNYFPTKFKVILCAINPVGKEKHDIYTQRISKINKSLEIISTQYSNVIYLNSFSAALSPTGYLLPEYHLSDNIHLSKRGYDLWIAKLIGALNNSKEKR